MKEICIDLAIIGGGPAGLAAAIEAKKQQIKNVMILERDRELGGILQQCIHDGFGLHRFNSRLTGCQYAQKFIDVLENTDIHVKLNTMVLEITKNKTIYACNSYDGMIKIYCRSIILAMGCRERTQSQATIYGTRPAGVLTAGAVQRYINMEGYLPGKKAVILGSGDIGLIMARRMTLEGIDVLGVYEIMEYPGGLTRNIVQCLDDYNIPLHLSTTVVSIHGKQHIESITIAKVDEKRMPIEGTYEIIPCDLLVLAVGLIPENELSVGLGLEMDPKTKGPVVDNCFMTNIPGIFAAGNVTAVFDLVDYVSLSGEIAARGAAEYLKGGMPADEPGFYVLRGNNINCILPQKVVKRACSDKLTFFLRAEKPLTSVRLKCSDGTKTIFSKNYEVVAPPEMLCCSVSKGEYSHLEIYIEEA